MAQKYEQLKVILQSLAALSRHSVVEPDMRKSIVLLLSGSFLCLAATPALAQMFENLAPNTAMNNLIFSNLAHQGQMSANQNSPIISAPRETASALFRPTYVPSPARRRANLARFVEKIRPADPIVAARMTDYFASTDVIEVIGRQMQQSYGMRPDNLADAFAVWWTSAWMGSQGRTDDPTRDQMQKVQRQAFVALASTPEFAAASDSVTQELAESLLVQAALIGDTIKEYQSDPVMLERSRQSVIQGAQTMGLDLRKMTLTDAGFVPLAQ
jgi:hypothetical protein